MRKHPVSINLSKHILALIDKEAEKEQRKRSDWVELHFKEHFKEATQPQEAAMKLG
jgi:metal-responsive CopG/Arc/MetJ family transcriptional regulator